MWPSLSQSNSSIVFSRNCVFLSFYGCYKMLLWNSLCKLYLDHGFCSLLLSLSLSIAVPGRNKQHTKMMASHMTLRDNTRKMMASHMTLRDNTPNNNASIKGFNSIINHTLGIQTPTFRPSKIWLAPLWRYASRAPNSHVFGCLDGFCWDFGSDSKRGNGLNGPTNTVT